VAGDAVAGRAPEEHLAGAYVQFVRFDGTELSDPVQSQHRLSGTVPSVLLDTEEVLRAQVETVTRFAGLPTEERAPSVPFEALQQLFRNAVLHRTYESSNAPVRVSWFDDRVEIQSPGGPFGQVTVETIGQPRLTDYRNPTLAGALSQLGFVLGQEARKPVFFLRSADGAIGAHQRAVREAYGHFEVLARRLLEVIEPADGA